MNFFLKAKDILDLRCYQSKNLGALLACELGLPFITPSAAGSKDLPPYRGGPRLAPKCLLAASGPLRIAVAS